ncbi:hypothetical protein K470DRAFT_70983 [Piedraia hortae CBS 480.64]|uniref:RING-type domain-containing protein n=1 Tax=Piedraia hortae CBS 480.64 TaxID=1314780 RepID=A0A6A7BZV8_9PEZI|nr:hypothetical protein K470DRAFT_70983 [Piedraia hortae CBS 480.64]
MPWRHRGRRQPFVFTNTPTFSTSSTLEYPNHSDETRPKSPDKQPLKQNEPKNIECVCCFETVSLSEVTHCNSGAKHPHCKTCIRRVMREAIYGQSWTRMVDHKREGLYCFSTTTDACTGHISSIAIHDSICEDDDQGKKIWTAFHHKCIKTMFFERNISTRECPFCSALHAIKPPEPPTKPSLLSRLPFLSSFHKKTQQQPQPQPQPQLPLLKPSTRRVEKFRCRNEACGKVSCLLCKSEWQKDHTCYVAQRSTLRHQLDEAASDLIKRICPRCNIAVVKESGCNTVTCSCNASFCFGCGKELKMGDYSCCRFEQEQDVKVRLEDARSRIVKEWKRERGTVASSLQMCGLRRRGAVRY